jgi:hypothetical protein
VHVNLLLQTKCLFYYALKISQTLLKKSANVYYMFIKAKLVCAHFANNLAGIYVWYNIFGDLYQEPILRLLNLQLCTTPAL